MADREIVLRPPILAHCREASTWPVDDHEARAWAGADIVTPVTADEMASWHRDPDVVPWMGVLEDRPIAYGEIWVDRAEREIEIARVIVNPADRNRGVGRSFVQALVERSRSFAMPDFFLRVRAENGAAQRCYEAVGFRRMPEGDQRAFNQNQPHDYVWMRYGSDASP